MSQAAKQGTSATPLAAPRFETAGPMLLAGLSQHYGSDMKGITAQWMQFGPHIGKIPGQVGRVAFGVWYNAHETPFSMDHTCAVEVSSGEHLPSDFSTLKLSAHRYAVFSHGDHVSTISGIVDAIFHSWLPTSGHAHDSTSGDKLAFYERYGENFDPRTGTGDIEIWVPIKE
jgi:AraC family transcriptional regulator